VSAKKIIETSVFVWCYSPLLQITTELLLEYSRQMMYNEAWIPLLTINARKRERGCFYRNRLWRL